ncbi:MAG: glycosyltransferase family 39 protein [Anaerolineae bacterium]
MRKLPLTRTRALLPIVCILLLGFVLRIEHLGNKNIWWDEGWSIGIARDESFINATLRVAADVHPPLYFWFLYWWEALVGDGEFATRFLSLMWGVLTIALVYPLARKFAPRSVALLAMLLTATSRFHVWWSQELRMYTITTFVTILSLYLVDKMLQENSRRSWVVYTLATILVPYSYYIAAVTLVAQNLLVMLTLRRRTSADRRFLFKWIASQFVICAAFVPWVILATSRMNTWSATTPFAIGLFVQLYVTVLSTGISTYINQWLLPTLGITSIALVGFVSLWNNTLTRWQEREQSRQAALLLALPLVSLPISVYLVSLNRELFYTPRIYARYLLIFAPLFYTLIACGIAGIWKRLKYAGWIVLALILALNGWLLFDYHAARYMRDDYHTAMLTLAAYADPDDALVLVSGDRYALLLYYYERYIPEDRRPPVYLVPSGGPPAVTRDNVDAQMSPIAANHERLWLASFERQIQDADNLVEGWLDARYSRPMDMALAHNHLALYTHDEQTPPVLTLDPQMAFDQPLNGGRLLGADLPTREFRPGDTAHLGLYVEGGTGQFPVRWEGKGDLVLGTRYVNLIDDGAIHRYDVPFPVAYGPAGQYQFTLADGTVLAQMTMRNTDSVPHEGVIQHPLPVQLGDAAVHIGFLGYDLAPKRPAPGDELVVTLYWQAPSPIALPYTVFVQLVGPHNPDTGNPLWGQHDGPPVEGTFPTDRWPAGLIVRDRHPLVIAPTTSPGDYQLIAGMYDPGTGERLTVPNTSDNAILLQTITITE